LFLWKPTKCIVDDGCGFCQSADCIVLGFRPLRALHSPPFRGAFPSNAEKIGAKCSTLRLEPVGPRPDLRKRLLHNVFCCLRITDNMPQEDFQARCVLPIELAKGLRVSLADPFPSLSIVGQSASLLWYSGRRLRKFTSRGK
jgi:hypothetical protein